jgi:hypothetical protein
MEDSLLPECVQGKRRLSPTANVEKEIAILTTVAAEVRGRRLKNVDHHRSTKSLVTKNFFAPKRAVTMEGEEVCGETPS